MQTEPEFPATPEEEQVSVVEMGSETWPAESAQQAEQHFPAPEDEIPEPVEQAASPEPALALVPMNEPRLRQYLENLEKNLLEVAYADCAGLLEFAADRVRMDMGSLQEKLTRYGISNS